MLPTPRCSAPSPSASATTCWATLAAFCLRRAKRERLQALRSDVKRLSLVARYTHNSILFTDRAGRVTWVNAACEALTGYTLDELRGQVPGKLLQCERTDPAAVARLRESVRRGTDLVARYGGEEFVCLLPDTDADDAVRLAGQLLDAVRLMAIPHRLGTEGGVLTISLGVATRRGPAQPGWQAAALLGLADAQLYEAKRAGRARVCAAVLGEDGGV